MADGGGGIQGEEGLPGQPVTLTLAIRATVKAHEEGHTRPTAYLRFTWLDGEHVVCGTVGEDGWTQVSDGDGDGDGDGNGSGSGGGDGSVGGGPAASNATVGKKEKTATYVWRREWADVQFDEGFACRLNDAPQLVVFMGEKVPAGPEGEGGDPVDRPWVSHVGLDVSPLLAGDLEMSSSISGAIGSSAVMLQATLTADKPALTDDLRLKLNPLAITVKEAVRLPGITLAEGVDPSLRRFVEPSPHSLLEQYCAPAFACYRLFDGDGVPRTVRTVGVAQGPSAKWHQKSVFLVGTFTFEEVQEHFISRPLEVEVHDRARLGECGRLTFTDDAQQRWARLLTDGVPSDASPAAQAAVAAATPDEADAPAQTGGPDGGAAEAAPRPLALSDADAFVACELEEAYATVGDHNPHGAGSLRLSPLLDRSRERLALLEQVQAHDQAVTREKAKTEAEARADLRAKRRAARVAALKKLGIAAGGGSAPSDPAEGEPVDGEDAAEGGDGDGGGAGAGSGVAASVPPIPSAGAGSDGIADGAAPKFSPRWDPGTGHDPIEQTFSVDILPRKRRYVPKTGNTDYDMTEGERLTTLAGSYHLNGARLKAFASLARPLYDLPPKVPPKPLLFTRVALVMKYPDDGLLKSALSVVEEVNMAALPHASSIRTYVLTDEENAGAKDGSLDIITGFQVVDANWRIVVLEGLLSGGMQKLRNRAERAFPNSRTIKYLANPDVQFTSRLYTDLGPAPKDIRLRDPLTLVMRSPGIYDRKKVSQLCFNGLFRLSEIRRASRLLQLKTFSLFPDVEMLLELENKYGDTVTLQDIYGRTAGSPKGSKSRSKASPLSPSASAPALSTTSSGTLGVTFDETATGGAHGRKSRHQPMETTNPAFLEHLQSRSSKPKDFIAMNRERTTELSKTLNSTASRRMEPTDTAGAEPPGGQVFVYSGQKLQYTEWQKERMRKRLEREKKSTFTYSQDFQSLTVCLVNEAEIQHNEKEEARSRWTTKRGFVYPAPRDPSEFAKLSNAPSSARREDLRQPWEDPMEKVRERIRQDSSAPSGKKKFDTVPAASTEFGYVDARGRKNPEFFKSVHLTGEGLEAELAAAKLREEEEWRSKMVVDNPRFLPHYGPKKSTQLHKIEGILAGPVRDKSLRIIHNARLPSGKKTVPPVAAPISVTAQGEYKDPVDFTSTLKPNDPAHFAGTDATGRKVDFATYINPHRLKPKSQTLRATRRIPPMSDSEKSGPKWGR